MKEEEQIHLYDVLLKSMIENLKGRSLNVIDLTHLVINDISGNLEYRKTKNYIYTILYQNFQKNKLFSRIMGDDGMYKYSLIK
jgi:hypothetical protein